MLLSSHYGNEPDGSGPTISYYVNKYAPLGEQVCEFYLSGFDLYDGAATFKMAVDAGGNMYVAAQGNNSYYIAKYTSTGSRIWDRSSL